MRIGWRVGSGPGSLKRINLFFFLALVVPVFLNARLFADSIVTVSGRVVEGHITEETDAWVKIQTPRLGIITLPRDQIRQISRQDVGPEEAEADRFYVRKDYCRALEQYERIKSESKGSEGLGKKIENTRNLIAQKEKEMFDGLFRQAADLSAQRRRDEARAALRKIVEAADPSSPAAARARRAIAAEYFRDSWDYRNMVRYSDAVTALERAVAADPTMVIAQFELARLYRDYTADARKTLAQFEKAVGIAKERMALDDSARKAFDDAQPPQAELDPEKVSEFRFELAELYFATGNKQQAAESFQSLLEDGTQELSKTKINDIIKRLGEALTDVNLAQTVDRAKTLQGLDIALKYNPNLSKAWFLKGRIFFDDGATSRAVECFTEAIAKADRVGESAPKDVYLFRARAYLHKGEVNSARHDLLNQLELEPSYEVRRLLGEVFLEGLDYTRALEQFNAAIAMEPALIPAMLGRAKVFRQQAMATRTTEQQKLELQEQARADIEKILETNANYPEAILEKGRLLRDQDRFAEAAGFFNKVIESFGSHDQARLSLDEKRLLASALCERGAIHMKNLNRNVAQADFERALEIRPGFPIAYRLLGDLARQGGNFERARDNYIKAIEYAPDDADLEISLALCYQELKQYREAIAHFEEHRVKGGTDIRVRDWIQECQTILQTQPR